MYKNCIANAKEIIKQYKGYLLVLMLMLIMIEEIENLFLQFQIIGLVVSILCLTIGHAEVVAGLKITGQLADGLNPQQDALYGFKHFKKLFRTYFIVFLLSTAMSVGMVLIISYIVFNTHLDFWNQLFLTINDEMQYGIYDTVQMVLSWGSLIILICTTFSDYLIKSLFFVAPYLLELEGFEGVTVLKVSYQKTKKYFKDIFLFQAHYYLQIIIFGCLNYLVMEYVDSVLLFPLLSISLMLLEIFVFRMEYVVSKAELYKKIVEQNKEANL